ncbi:uncharacterized protein LOC119986171 [Tripterygium wilfordii]|uniref:uncharacterized protein LOC119986171 n=1 Tax=Tripterygium wilfordii TaxID=458696 RepID=UPI0018F8062A|nr:uncharacterized protein LOC119986171 [Tripterygium wilfordii]
MVKMKAQLTFTCNISVSSLFSFSMHFPPLLDGIQFERNSLLHEGRRTGQDFFMQKVYRFSTEFEACSGQPRKVMQRNEGINSAWSGPGPGMIKLNIDGAVFLENDAIGVGAILRDQHGSPLLCFSENVAGRVDPTFAELLAVNRTLTCIEERGYHDFILELDSSNIVQALGSDDWLDSRMGHFVSDTKAIMARLGVIKCQHVCRSGNEVAHTLARMAKFRHGSSIWVAFCPMEIVPLVRKDISFLCNVSDS